MTFNLPEAYKKAAAEAAKNGIKYPLVCRNGHEDVKWYGTLDTTCFFCGSQGTRAFGLTDSVHIGGNV